MSGSSNIEWTNATWNPLTGCTLVSEGCRNCYAAREAAGRLSHHPAYAGLATKRGGRPVFTGEVRLHEDRLGQPLLWRKPRRVFVNSMSDLFHPDVPDSFIGSVFAVMGQAPRHTFQILTKRPQRMAEWVSSRRWRNCGFSKDAGGDVHASIAPNHRRDDDNPFLPNVWLGTSVEDQKTADERIPHLLEAPAAVRFLSCEPLLGPVDLRPFLQPKCLTADSFEAAHPDAWRPRADWVIVGGESGPKARPMHPDWARQLRDQCVGAGVAFHFKQWGEWAPGEPDAIGSAGMMQQQRYQRSELLDSQGHIRDTNELRTFQIPDDWARVSRYGKKSAGRQLDGRTWDEAPA